MSDLSDNPEGSFAERERGGLLDTIEGLREEITSLQDRLLYAEQQWETANNNAGSLHRQLYETQQQVRSLQQKLQDECSRVYRLENELRRTKDAARKSRW